LNQMQLRCAMHHLLVFFEQGRCCDAHDGGAADNIRLDLLFRRRLFKAASLRRLLFVWFSATPSFGATYFDRNPWSMTDVKEQVDLIIRVSFWDSATCSG
jgi:hypothetical protein